jgi:hypothetical protein
MAKTRTITRYVKVRSKRRHKSFTIPVGVVLGLVPLVNETIVGFKADGVQGAGQNALAVMTGYYPKTKTWNGAWLKQGLMPLMLGFGVHWLASKMGVNRALGRAGIPLLRI